MSRNHCIATLVPFLIACASAPKQSIDNCDTSSWQALLAEHQERYPAMEIFDALKLLQQATLGSAHAVTDSAGAAVWMEREWGAMGSGPVEPLVDTLGDGGYARVHLRRYRDAGGDPEQLTAAFIATSRTTPDTALLGCAVAAVSSVVPWDSASWQATAAQWRVAGYPAMHHSAGFRAAYLPAYRVVGIDQILNLSSTQ